MKICTLCGEIKELDLFKIDTSRKDGRSSWCKACHSKKVTEYQRKNRHKCNINNMKYSKTPKGIEAKKNFKRSEAGIKCKHRYLTSDTGRAASARHASNRRTRERAVINDLTSIEWSEILESQGYRCKICDVIFDSGGIKTKAERDHIRPLSKGGSLTKSNVQALCKSCNCKKGARWDNSQHCE